LGARQDADYTYASATATAAALKAAGINHNFAPVVDVNTNPANPVIGALGRSFSADPDVVAEQAAAFIRAHRDQGITTTLKHFPGHGSSRADSHVGFVDVTDTWQELELLPYRELIRLGLVDAIMTAHVFNAQLDMETVATLSKPILTGLLREQLGFDGVIFSDDMYMGAIARHFDFADAVVRAVEAGVDVITVSAHLADGQSVAARIVDILAAAVDDGRLSETRINDSYRRIVTLKQSWG
jgi:beta-N-acetylhexosaminidase